MLRYSTVWILLPALILRVLIFGLNSRLCLHEGHAGGLVVVRVDGRHHLTADRVENRKCGQRPGDLTVLGHAPQLLAGLLDGAVVDQLDAGGEGDAVAFFLKAQAGVIVMVTSVHLYFYALLYALSKYSVASSALGACMNPKTATSFQEDTSPRL